MTVPILPWLVVFFPIFAGSALFLVPGRAHGFRERFSVLTVAITFVLSLWLLVRPQMAFSAIPLGFVDGYLVDLRMDELNRFMVMFASLFGLLGTLYSMGYMRGRPRLREYYPYVLLTVGAANGALLSNNWLGFIAFWGVVLVTLFLLTTIGAADAEPGKAMRAAGKSLVILGAADIALIVGVGLLFVQSETLTLSETSLRATTPASIAAFVLILSGALSKAGAMPLHSWLPDMAEAAPTSVTALLPASLDKLLGVYLLARLVLDIFGVTPGLNLLLMLIGAVTLVAAVVMAMVQHDLRKLLSFHAVSQVGYMVLGIGTGTPIGVAGGLFHMLNNAIYKGALFLTAGAVEKKTGTMDLARLGGLGRLMPVTFASFGIAGLAISGIPPFNGFVSKWMIYQGLVEAGIGLYWPFLVAAMFGSALTLASFVKVGHSVFLGERPRELSGVSEIGASMRVPFVVLATLCVVFGIAAQVPLLYFIGPAVGLEFPGFPGAIEGIGLWSPTLGTALLLISLVVGYLVYLSARTRTVRAVPGYIGGETVGEGSTESLSTRFGRSRQVTGDTRVLGTEFYDSVRELPGLRGLYSLGESRTFDIERLGRLAPPIGRVFSVLHGGRLSTYASWVVWGMIILAVVLIIAP